MRHARGGHDDVGTAQVIGEIAGAGMAQGDGGVLAASGEKEPERPADSDAATDDHDVRSGDRHVVASEQRDNAPGRARERSILAEDEAAEVRRMEAIGILRWIHELEGVVRVELTRQWKLDDVAGHARVGVEPSNLCIELCLGRISGQIDPDRLDTDLGAIAVLARNVRVAAGILPDEHGAEPRMLARGLQCVNPGSQVGFHLGRSGLSIKNRRRHEPIVADASRFAYVARLMMDGAEGLPPRPPRR